MHNAGWHICNADWQIVTHANSSYVAPLDETGACVSPQQARELAHRRRARVRGTRTYTEEPKSRGALAPRRFRAARWPLPAGSCSRSQRCSQAMRPPSAIQSVGPRAPERTVPRTVVRAIMGGKRPVRFLAATRGTGHSVHGRGWPKGDDRIWPTCTPERTLSIHMTR
jgi:hypothetical protein